MKKQKTVLVFFSAIFLFAISPFSSGCACIPKTVEFEHYFHLESGRTDPEIISDLKEKLTEFNLHITRETSSNQYQANGIKMGLEQLCSIKPTSTAQHVSCNVWLEDKMFIVNKGWQLDLFITSEGKVSQVDVKRVYNALGLPLKL